jgi:ectoine hydroxylase-related dioxygenase (phytanoyl-CoA dioxygenase family)
MKPMPTTMAPSTKATQESWFRNMPWVDKANADVSAYCQENTEDSFDLKEKLEQWRRDGVVIFENAIDSAAIDDLLSELNSLISDPSGFDLEMDLAGQRKPIREFSPEELRKYDKLKFNNIHYISPAARALSLSPVVVKFLGHIFQDTPCAMQTLCFNKGSQQPVHADFAFVYNQTDLSFMAASWIPLEDIQPGSGPLAYYPGTHQVANFGFYDFGDGEIILTNGKNLMSAQEFSEWLGKGIEQGQYEKRIFLPKKGDVLIWHAALLHEGTKISNPATTRKSLVTHYTGRSKMPDSHKTFGDKGELQEIQHNGGVVLKHRWVDYSKQL